MVPGVLPGIQNPTGASLCSGVSSLNTRRSKKENAQSGFVSPTVSVKRLALRDPRNCSGAECGDRFTSRRPLPTPPHSTSPSHPLAPYPRDLLLLWELL